MKRAFTANYQKRGKRYVAWIEEVPGVNTQGRTLKETKANLKEALRLVLEAHREIFTSEFQSVEKPIRESLTISVRA